VVASRSLSYSIASAIRFLFLDLTWFIVEHVLSRTYVFPIIECIFSSKFFSLGNASIPVVPKLIRAVTQIKVARMSYYLQYFAVIAPNTEQYCGFRSGLPTRSCILPTGVIHPHFGNHYSILTNFQKLSTVSKTVIVHFLTKAWVCSNQNHLLQRWAIKLSLGPLWEGRI